MNYKIVHSTTYIYNEPVRVCRNQLLLTPREDSTVKCSQHRINIKPNPGTLDRRTDFFGNAVHSFAIEDDHRQLNVTATSQVNVTAPPVPEPEATLPWNGLVRGIEERIDPRWFETSPYRFASPRIRLGDLFADYAKTAFTPDRPILASLLELNGFIHRDFRYDTEATTVDTSIEEAFAARHGVCQDFAQIAIACLRSVGLPARYVSGYLRTIPKPGKPRLVGADQSHAWVSVYVGEPGWIDFDPTNNILCGTDHIPIAWGRDYGDVAPIRGVFLGRGAHQIRVSVDVAPIGESAAAAPGAAKSESQN